MKQSSRCWNEALDKHLKCGFKQSKNDPCIYVLDSGGEIFLTAILIDDIIFTGKTSERIQKFINAIAEKFNITDMGKLHHFVGIKIKYLNSGNIWIRQPAYVRKVLRKFKIDNSKAVGTPVDIGTKLVQPKDGDNLVDQELHQSDVGSLLYLSTKTRPDIAYAVGNVSHFSSKPTQIHWIAVKRIMRYLNGTPDFELLYLANDSITGFSGPDWAGDHDDRKSTYRFVLS